MSGRARELLKRDPWLLGIFIWALVYAAVVLWFTRRGSALPPDATDYAEAARSLVRGQGDTINRVMFHTGVFPAIRHPLEVHGLLQPFLLAPLFWIWGPEAALVRIPSVLFAASLGVFVFWTGRRLFGTAAGLVASALIFTRSDLVFLSLLGSDDVGFALFSFGALSCVVPWAESGKRSWAVGTGIFSALAALQKFSGMVLPAVVAGLLVLSPRIRRMIGLPNWLYAAGPVVPVLALYVFRNYRVYGTLGSPYGGIEWLGKDQMSAYFAYYPDPPTPSEVWAQIGVRHGLMLIFNEFKEFLDVFWSDVLLLVGAPLVIWLFRRTPAFSGFVALYTLAMAWIVCVAHHVETRYLYALVPMCAVAVGAIASSVLAWIEARIRPAGVRVLRISALILLVSVTLGLSRKALALTQFVGLGMQRQSMCADMLKFVAASVAPEAPILTSNPWFISWETGRPAVNAPTNGDRALIEVVRRYRIPWAVTGAPSLGTLNLAAALQSATLQAALRPELAFDGGECKVYRLYGHTPQP